MGEASQPEGSAYEEPLRVLLVEDIPDWQARMEKVLDSLRNDGIETSVCTAGTYEAAHDAVLGTYFDLAIVDLVLHAGHPGDIEEWEGFWLLQDLFEIGLQRETAVVVLTSFDLGQVADLAFTRFGALRFISKNLSTDEIRTALLQVLNDQQHFGMSTAITLTRDWRSLVSDLGAAQMRRLTAPVPADEAAVELEHLVRRLERDCIAVTLAPLEGGNSGAAVARLTDRQHGELHLADSLLKYGTAPSIRRETDGFSLLQDLTNNYKTTQIRGAAFGRHLGTIEYNLVGASAESAVPFANFYRDGSVAEIEACITELFEETCGRWYQPENCQRESGYDLERHYASTLHFTRESVSQAYLFKFGVGSTEAERLELPDVPRRLPDPVYALEAGQANWLVDTWLAPTHGDLHGGNLLTDTSTGSAWLIDFGAAGFGHWARDFAALECCIKFQYVEPRDLARLYEFEDGLAEGTSGLPVPLGAGEWTDRLDLAKAVPVIRRIRRLAKNAIGQLGGVDFERDYNAALYFVAVNYLRLHSLLRKQKRKYQVLMSASLAVERVSQTNEASEA